MTWMRCGCDIDDDAGVADDAGVTWMRCGHDVDDDAGVTWMRCGYDVDGDAGVDGDAVTQMMMPA